MSRRVMLEILLLCCLPLLFAAAEPNANTVLDESYRDLESGRPHDALAAARRSVDLAQDNGQTARAQLQIARVLAQLGRPIEAEDALTVVSTLVPADSLMALEVQNELGAVWDLRGEYQTAADHYRKALELAPKVGLGEEDQARVLINLLNAEIDSGQVEDAPSQLAQLQTLVDRQSEVDTGVLLSAATLLRRIQKELGGPTNLRRAASTLLLKAQARAESSKDERSDSLAIGLQGALYVDESRFEDGLRLTEIALFLAQESDSLDLVYRWEAQIGAILLSQQDRVGARAAFERAVAALSEVRRDLPAGSPRMFSEQVMPVYNGLADVLLQQASAEADPAAKQELLGRVITNLEDLKQAEVEDYFARECVEEGDQYTSSMLADSAIVYPVFLRDRTEILLETRAGLHQFIIDVPRAKMTSEIRELRTELEDYDFTDDYIETAEVLEEWLIDPMEATLDELSIKTLVFIPDGPLRTIPMAALYDGEQFLIERYALASTPAIRLTKANIASTKNALIGGITEGVQGFSPLRFVGPELDQVSKILPGPRLQDTSFALAGIESKFDEADYSIVHFATHGMFSSDFRKSFLLAYDDKFTMSRLERALSHQSGLDLLVLSACETAAGDDRAALGLAGVAIQAGAESALASLWSISDEGTAELIPAFYNGLYNEGLTKAESLREAQIKLLKDPRFDHPVFWAPYILIGNWI